VAHEVRNPLAGIKGAMQVLIARRDAQNPEIGVLRDIVARVDSLNELIGDLMLFARPRPPQMKDVDLKLIALEAIAMARRDPSGQTLEIQLDGAPAPMTADGDMMRAALLNLLLNAGQAMGGNGRVVVEFAIPGDTIEITVRDEGPGIPAELRDQVFEPFFTTKARGGGLGLPIARRTAEIHGGTLTVSCPTTGGTVMRLTLPTVRAGQARPSARPAPALT